jgi:hypothetical protein
MTNIQQTAVEWFSVRRDVLEIEVRLGKLSPIEYAEERTKAEQKAKEMEKEKMIEFVIWLLNGGMSKEAATPIANSYYEHFMNETYGGGKQ